MHYAEVTDDSPVVLPLAGEKYVQYSNLLIQNALLLKSIWLSNLPITLFSSKYGAKNTDYTAEPYFAQRCHMNLEMIYSILLFISFVIMI